MSRPGLRLWLGVSAPCDGAMLPSLLHFTNWTNPAGRAFPRKALAERICASFAVPAAATAAGAPPAAPPATSQAEAEAATAVAAAPVAAPPTARRYRPVSPAPPEPTPEQPPLAEPADLQEARAAAQQDRREANAAAPAVVGSPADILADDRGSPEPAAVASTAKPEVCSLCGEDIGRCNCDSPAAAARPVQQRSAARWRGSALAVVAAEEQVARLGRQIDALDAAQQRFLRVSRNHLGIA
eukprot:SAG22_NODE_130_length_18670_cov_12.091379_13_plen_241_part_00